MPHIFEEAELTVDHTNLSRKHHCLCFEWCQAGTLKKQWLCLGTEAQSGWFFKGKMSCGCPLRSTRGTKSVALGLTSPAPKLKGRKWEVFNNGSTKWDVNYSPLTDHSDTKNCIFFCVSSDSVKPQLFLEILVFSWVQPLLPQLLRWKRNIKMGCWIPFPQAWQFLTSFYKD